MSRLADRAGVSRKTVYNHFTSVEDLVVALAVQSTARRADLFARAAVFHGSTRERIAGIAAVGRSLLPHHVRHEALLSAITMERTPLERQLRLRREEERLLGIVAGVIRDAVSVGDLTLPPLLSPERLGLALHQMEMAPFALAQRGFGLGGHSLEVTSNAVIDALTLMLDDLGWKPLSTELDYLASIRRMWQEVFPDLVERFCSPTRRPSPAPKAEELGAMTP